MEFHGSNAAYGTETVEITERRWADPLVQPSEEQPAFPCGLGGLVPVRTMKVSSVETLTYVFPFGEGVLESDEGYDEDVPRIQVAEVQKPLLNALLGAIELINGLLVQASELSGYTFGQVGAIQVGATEVGVGFTRVEPFPAAQDKVQADVALTLHVETTDQMPGTPGSFSAVVDYDAAGEPVRIAMLEYTDDDFVFRAAANIDEKTGELSIHKVERIDRTVHAERLMYKRGRETRGERHANRPSNNRGDRYARDGYDDRRGSRDRDFGGRDRGQGRDRYDRDGRGGRYDRRERDDRGGRYDRSSDDRREPRDRY